VTARSPRLRRRYPRLTLRVRVAIESPGRALLEGTATTLGAGGLFVPTAEPLPLHAPLQVRFHLPGDDDAELCFHAHVAWTRAGASGSAGMGIAFDDANARTELAARLERWADLREASRSGASGV
jgi:Tfp pilus assembly protein PilZ